MTDDPQPVTIKDKTMFDAAFSTYSDRPSDYTFAQVFIWRNGSRIWKIIKGHLCVFVTVGSWSLLFPPLGNGPDFDEALAEATEICKANGDGQESTLIECAAAEDMARMPADRMQPRPISGDYVYATQRMIDLAGGALASKRQARNQFVKKHKAAVSDFRPAHTPVCLDLLDTWRDQMTDHPAHTKRGLEVEAAREAVLHAEALGLRGMVLYADGNPVGFTLGEMLTPDTCSIIIEKTDRNYNGAAQFIFSEFCRRNWPHTTFVNAGDDWEVPGLAWTKQSYRPVRRVPKFAMWERVPVKVQT